MSGRDKKGRFIKGSTGHLTHGLYRTSFHTAYWNMVYRCTKKSNKSWGVYGGRGIKCLWKSFEEFYLDMFSSYKEHVDKHGEKETTLDRVDNNKSYYKENCRWATHREQSRHKRTIRYLTYRGKTQSMADWSRELKLDIRIISRKILKGKTTEEALKHATRRT